MKFGEKIGGGGEKEVFLDENNPEKVIAVYREKVLESETSNQTKGRYYLGKILHLLFPDNIPDIFLAYDNRDKEEKILSLERKRPDSEHVAIQDIYTGKIQGRTRERAREYLTKILNDNRYLELTSSLRNLGIQFDMGPQNYAYDEGGNLLLLDYNFKPWAADGEFGFSVEKMTEAINNIADERNKIRAQELMKRIVDLRSYDLNNASRSN